MWSSLKIQLSVGQRPLLTRIPTSDYVVIMDDEEVELVDGEVRRQTQAGILKMAITEVEYRYFVYIFPVQCS